MTKSYGKLPRGGKKTGTAPSDSLVVKIHGRHDIEQFSLELQKAVAQLHDLGAFGVEACSIYLKPLDEKGSRIALWDEKGEPITRLEISAPEAPPPYRQS